YCKTRPPRLPTTRTSVLSSRTTFLALEPRFSCRKREFFSRAPPFPRSRTYFSTREQKSTVRTNIRTTGIGHGQCHDPHQTLHRYYTTVLEKEEGKLNKQLKDAVKEDLVRFHIAVDLYNASQSRRTVPTDDSQCYP
ncbi:unnamed protein product, partial [Owenia fusiformis]